MIVWLASYPKSGNTLLRSILSSYFFSNDGEFKFENLYDKAKSEISQDEISPITPLKFPLTALEESVNCLDKYEY